MTVETYYDIQNVRTATDHRVRQYAEHEALVAMVGEVDAESLKREGIPTYKKAIKEKKEDPVFVQAFLEAQKFLEDEEHHKKVNKLMRDQETTLKRLAMEEIAEHPLWTNWLKYVRGIGPCLAGGLLAWINIEQCRHASHLIRYAGQSVVIDHWKCRACEKEMPHHQSFIGKDHFQAKCPNCSNLMEAVGHAERRVKGEKTPFNPRVKTLVWKIGESFVKQNAKRSGYRKLYEEHRRQVEAKPCTKVHKDKQGKVIPCFDAHKFAKAKRLTVKVFLCHLYEVWRKELGLWTSDPFIFWKGHDKVSYIAPIFDVPKEGPAAEE